MSELSMATRELPVSVKVSQDNPESEQGRADGLCPMANLKRCESPRATFIHPSVHSFGRHLAHAHWTWDNAGPRGSCTVMVTDKEVRWELMTCEVRGWSGGPRGTLT